MIGTVNHQESITKGQLVIEKTTPKRKAAEIIAQQIESIAEIFEADEEMTENEAARVYQQILNYQDRINKLLGLS